MRLSVESNGFFLCLNFNKLAVTAVCRVGKMCVTGSKGRKLAVERTSLKKL